MRKILEEFIEFYWFMFCVLFPIVIGLIPWIIIVLWDNNKYWYLLFLITIPLGRILVKIFYSELVLEKMKIYFFLKRNDRNRKKVV
jgi:hypothetical protein